MEIAFHCPNCLADLIFDESKKYTCCFCHTALTAQDEVHELEGGYYVGDAWNDNQFHRYKCEDCDGEFVIKTSAAKQGCPLCSSTSLKDQGPEIGAMPKRAIPFAHTKQQAEEIFLDYIRNNSAVGRSLATDENKALLHKAYVPCWVFTYEVVAYAKLTVTLRNKANDNKTIMGIKGSEQIAELLSPIRSSISRFQANRKGAKDTSNQPSEHVTGGVLSWQGIPFDATGILPENLMNSIQPYDQSKLITLTDKVLGDTPVLAILKDPITCMQEFMDRVKKWTRQMIMDAHSDSYDILHFSDKTDYPLGIGELVLFPIWYMKGDYSGREYFFAMNGQNGEIDANIPMSKLSRKTTVLPYQAFWDKSRCSALNDTHFEFNIHDPNIEILDYSFFEKPRDSKVTADGRKKTVEKKASIEAEIPVVKETETTEEEPKEKPEAETASKGKKPSVPLDVQVVTDLKSLPKKLSKEEEAKRDKEKAARIRAAARDTAKKPMEAAAEAPSWAKAVTPPPATSNSGARPVRTKKPGMGRSSVASSGNKPIWERPEDSGSGLKKQVNKPTSLAEQVARAQMGEAPVPQEEPKMNLGGGQKPIWSREPEDELEFKTPLPGPELMSLSSFLDKRAREDKENGVDRQKGEPAREVQVRSFDGRGSSGSLVESDDEVLAQARREAEEYAASLRAAEERAREQISDEIEFPEIPEVEVPEVEVSTPSFEEYRGEAEKFSDAAEIPELPDIPDIPEEITSPFAVTAPEPELPELQEYTEGNEDMVANITFSFNKKNAAAEREHNRMSGSSIPRMPEQKPTQAQGMAIMNSEYDSGVLPGVKRQSDVVEYRPLAPIASEERIPEVSENYFGSDENDRPLAYRPASPLARARDVEFVEEVEPHPELDANNRPLASRPAAPLARVTEVTPSIDYINEHGVVEGLEEDVHQMPSLAKSTGRWGEMPEAKETPAWAKPQGGFQETRESRLGSPRERTRRPSRDEMMSPRSNGRYADEQAQDSEPQDRSGAFRRPGFEGERPAAPTRRRPEDVRPSAARGAVERPAARPGVGRPGSRYAEEEEPMGRPSAERPSARAPMQKPEKQVPIWERVPDDSRPMPAWGRPISAYDDERPAGSLTKPKDQIIDVEKPRTTPGLGGLSRELGQAKEILPGGESREVSGLGRGSAPARSREVNPTPPPQRRVLSRREAVPEVEVEMPQVERGFQQPRREFQQPRREFQQPRQEAAPRAERPMPGFSARREEPENRSARMTEDEGGSLVFSNERPRTYAQRRQMEEQERQSQLRSSFRPQQEQGRPGSPFRPARTYEEEPVENDHVNASFEPTQFENKPSVVASLDMLPEPIAEEEARHLAKQEDVPSLARGRDVFHQDLAEEQRNAMRAMRDLPDFDPDGPSPFKRNR
ncbi:MAG: hypothetical protein J5752_11295 [Clostridiales bacterium]|nr:hypothetical protein [Clostridiales bacterium]